MEFQIIFFQHFDREKLKQMRWSSLLSSAGCGLDVELHNGLQNLLLALTYFNIVHSMPIFFYKIVCMLDSTWGLFMFIKCMRSQPLITAFGLYLAVLAGIAGMRLYMAALSPFRVT